MTPEPVVSAKGISKTFGEGRDGAPGHRSRGRAGRVHLAHRPVGMRKSTCLRVVGDLVEPSTGEILVNGKTAHRARLDRDYGIVFQAAVLYDWRTVTEHRSRSRLLGWSRARRAERVGEMR